MGPVSLNKKLFLSGVELRRARGPVEPCPRGLMLLRLVEVLAGVSPNPSVQSALRHLQNSLQEGASFSWAFHRLSAQEKTCLEAAVGKAIIHECLALSVEKDLSEVETAVFRITTCLEARGNLLGAMAAYQALLTTSQSSAAQARLDALMGKSSPGARFEVLLGDFSKQATDCRMILPMMAGTFSYGMTRAASLGFFGRYRSIAQTRRLAALAGFGVEVPVFSFSARALHQWSGDPVSWEGKEVWRDLASAGMTLGLLKIAGGMGHRAHGKLSVAYPALSGASQWLLPQGAAYSGLLAAHGLETWVGLRERVAGENVALNSLATLVSLGVGAKLGNAILGPSLTPFSQEYQLRSEVGLRQFSNSKTDQGYKMGSDKELAYSIPRRLRLIDELAKAANVPGFLRGGGQELLENYYGSHFNPYLRKISAPTRGLERVYSDAEFEIYLRQLPSGTLIHNGRPDGGMSRRDGLFLVRDGAWDKPMEVRPLAALSAGDFILWRRVDGEREVRVFEKYLFPFNVEEFPQDKLLPPRRRPKSSPSLPKSASKEEVEMMEEEVDAKASILNLPAPEIVEEEYWYEGVRPKSLQTLEVKDEDINVEVSVTEAPISSQSVESRHPWLDREEVREFFKLRPGQGLDALKRNVFPFTDEVFNRSPNDNDEVERLAANRIFDLVFSDRKQDKILVQEIRNKIAARLYWVETPPQEALVKETLLELSKALEIQSDLNFLRHPSPYVFSRKMISAMRGHFYPDDLIVYPEFVKAPSLRSITSNAEYVPIPSVLQLHYGMPPQVTYFKNSLIHATTLGEFRKKIFPWVEPWIEISCDLSPSFFYDDLLLRIPLARFFSIDGKRILYQIDLSALEPGHDIFTFKKLFPLREEEFPKSPSMPKVFKKPGSGWKNPFAPPEIDDPALKRSQPKFQVRIPVVRTSDEYKDIYQSVVLEFLEKYIKIPMQVVEEGQLHDLWSIFETAELENPSEPLVKAIRALVFPPRFVEEDGHWHPVEQVIPVYSKRLRAITHLSQVSGKISAYEGPASSSSLVMALITQKGASGFSLKDEGSAFRSSIPSQERIHVNGLPMEPGGEHLLQDFDVIQFGPDGKKLTWFSPGHPGTPQNSQESP